MDKISKALKRLNAKERKTVKSLLEKIQKGDTQGLNVKKLKERDDVFRARKGDMRIIYRRKDNGISVLAMERRSEKTYKNL